MPDICAYFALGIIVLVMLLLAITPLFATMRSSQISRDEEEREAKNGRQ